jgi:hypothetical protein
MSNALKPGGTGRPETPTFTPPEDRPSCSVDLVGAAVLLFLGSYRGTGNHHCQRRDLPMPSAAIAAAIFDALASANDPGPGGTAGEPPYYVLAAGMTDAAKFHKARSTVLVEWIKRPHQAGTNVWMPGIYLSPMRRLRRVGSAEGLGDPHNRGPIPPDDHERIGREVLELFDLIRSEYDGGPLPLRR